MRRTDDEALTPLGRRARAMVALARAQGCGGGPKLRVPRGRMDEALVENAKRRTGIRSDSALIEAAHAHLAMADDYPARLAARRGSVPPDVDLEF
jgi:hypothetical protein